MKNTQTWITYALRNTLKAWGFCCLLIFGLMPNVSAQTCNYTLELEDSYGDGWNGASIEVIQEGNLLNTYTFTSGYSATYTIDLNEGASIELRWNQGIFASECSYRLLNSQGIVVHSFSTGQSPSNNAIFHTFTSNCVPLPEVTLSLDVTEIQENGGQATLTASLSAPANQEVVINLGLSGNTLIDEDYSLSANPIIIPIGQSGGSTLVTALDDNYQEGDENIDIGIESLTNALELTPQNLTLTILDDLGDNELAPDEYCLYKIELSYIDFSEIEVRQDGLAIATYAGDDEQIRNIYLRRGSLIELVYLGPSPCEYFKLRDEFDIELYSFSCEQMNMPTDNSTFYSFTANCTNVLPGVNLSLDVTEIQENGGQATLTPSFSAPASQEVVINLGLSGNTLINEDYSLSANSIIIPVGQSEGTALITALDDNYQEGDESIDIRIANLNNAAELYPQNFTLTILDDAEDSEPVQESYCRYFIENYVDLIDTGLGDYPSIIEIFQDGVSIILLDEYYDTDIYFKFGSKIDFKLINDGPLVFTLKDENGNIIYTLKDENGNIIYIPDNPNQGDIFYSFTANCQERVPEVYLNLDVNDIDENGGQATLTATLSEMTDKDVTLYLKILGAIPDEDYNISNTTITIPAGNLEGFVTITALEDDLMEGDEVLVISIDSLRNAFDLNPELVNLLIRDDTSDTEIPIDYYCEYTMVFGNNYGYYTKIEIIQNGISMGLYEGENQDSISIYLKRGSYIEIKYVEGKDFKLIDENEVEVYSFSFPYYSDRPATGTILNGFFSNCNQKITEVTLDLNTLTIQENGGQAVLTASLPQPATEEVTVQLHLWGALPNEDYTIEPSHITIPVGSMTGSLVVTGISDNYIEGDEVLYFSISDVVGAVDFLPQILNLTIQDDTLDTEIEPISYCKYSLQGSARVKVFQDNVLVKQYNGDFSEQIIYLKRGSVIDLVYDSENITSFYLKDENESNIYSLQNSNTLSIQ